MNGPTRVGHWLDLHGLGLLHRFIHWAYCLNLAPLLIPKKRVASATSQGGGGGGPPPTVTYWISTYNNSNPAFALETQIPTLSQAEGDAQGAADFCRVEGEDGQALANREGGGGRAEWGARSGAGLLPPLWPHHLPPRHPLRARHSARGRRPL